MARGRASPFNISLALEERAELEHWQRCTTIKARLAKRAKIILLRADGHSLSEIARRLEVGRRIVRKWVTRFLAQRIAGLMDQPGRGRKRAFAPDEHRTSGQDSL